MTEIRVTIEDNALPTVQAALDEYNNFLLRATQPQVTLEQFVNLAVVGHFNISQEAIAARDRSVQRDAIIGKIDSAKVDDLKKISEAIDAVLVKV